MQPDCGQWFCTFTTPGATSGSVPYLANLVVKRDDVHPVPQLELTHPA